MKKYMQIILIISTIIVLFGLRLLWFNLFSANVQLEIKDGLLDLRNYEGEIETIHLDGEWNFYPNTWLIDLQNERKESAQPITVPGSWDEILQNETDSIFGYGSYHLKILVDSNDDSTYTLQVPSVRSSSELYVNGRYLGGYGKVGEDELSYIAENIPLVASFTADDNGVIDIV